MGTTSSDVIITLGVMYFAYKIMQNFNMWPTGITKAQTKSMWNPLTISQLNSI